VGFTLTSRERVLIEAPPAGSREERFYQVFGERPDLYRRISPFHAMLYGLEMGDSGWVRRGVEAIWQGLKA